MWIINRWNRPNIKMERTMTDKLLEAVVVILLVSLWGLSVYFWNILPEQIPSHFNFHGNVDGYSGKSYIFFITGMGTLAILIMGLAAYNPKLVNIPVKVNTPAQYALVCRMARVANVVMCFLFIALLLQIVCAALGIHTICSRWLHRVSVIALLLVLVFYTLRIHRIRKR